MARNTQVCKMCRQTIKNCELLTHLSFDCDTGQFLASRSMSMAQHCRGSWCDGTLSCLNNLYHFLCTQILPINSNVKNDTVEQMRHPSGDFD